MNMNEDYDALTDKLLEVSMKLRAAESKLKEVQSKHDKELSKFAHNLKNPVGVISSFVDMLKGNASMDEEKRSKYLDIIQNSSQFSLALVNSFQEYNKLAHDGVDFEVREINYLELINELFSENTAIKNRNQSIELNLNCKPFTNLNLDKSQFKNAFSNILNNASRYSDEDSSVQIDISENDDFVITTISDFGIGISKEDLPNLTQPFFTVNTYDEYKEKCIGLGLTKAKLILNKMNGDLSFSSELGKGTQVEIMLKKV